MSVITEPPQDDVPLQGNRFKTVWTSWFKSVFLAASSVTVSGPTSQRPTTNLWIGKRYFDTTLGKPVYLKSTSPNVWVDGVGTVS